MDHPSPHMVGLLDAIARIDEVSAEVVYFRSGAPERSWGDPPGDLPFRVAASSKNSSGLLNVPAVLRTMTKVHADIWVVNTCYTAPETWAAIGLLNRLRLPWVYMNERPRMRGYSDGIKRGLLRLMLRQAAGIIGMGQEAQTQYCKLTNESLPSTSVPYYLDLSEFLALVHPAVPDLLKPVRFFTAARMIYSKAFDVLLAACEKLPDTGWTLTLAGDGPLRPELERAFGARWGRDKVRFVGHIPYDERATTFAGQHVFVFPSRADGWGMAPVEAMAAGLPVISSDQVMSMRELIREDKNGFLVTKENATDLAERMCRLIAHPNRIPDMGRAARETVADYRPEVGAERLICFLSELVRPVSRESVQYSETAPSGLDAPQTWRSLTEPKQTSDRLRLHSRALAKRAVINISLALGRRFVPHGNRILVYHLVLREDRARFEEHLTFLQDHYRVVTAHELFQCRDQEHSCPLIAISFDDGFRVLMSDALELLEKHRVKATFYVPTGFIELASDPVRAAQFSLRAHYYECPLAPMTVEDLRELRRLGHEVGSHGVSHVSLTAVSHLRATRELGVSRSRLAEWLGEPVAGFAYPYGHADGNLGKISDWVASAGYEYAVTTQRGAVRAESNSMQLEREHAEGKWRVKDLAYFLSR